MRPVFSLLRRWSPILVLGRATFISRYDDVVEVLKRDNDFAILNSLVSPTSHGCVRMCNSADEALHTLMPSPAGNKIIIRTTPEQ